MKNIKKIALRTGVDENSCQLEYLCPKCHSIVPLGAKRCPNCDNKRPKDAYERAIEYRAYKIREKQAKIKQATPADYFAQKLPMPKAPCYSSPEAATQMRSCYATDAMQQLGIPKFYSSDEYGRVFEMPTCYKPLPVAGPVPVPAPSVVIQTSAINVPVSFGPTNQ